MTTSCALSENNKCVLVLFIDLVVRYLLAVDSATEKLTWLELHNPASAKDDRLTSLRVTSATSWLGLHLVTAKS